MGNFYCPGNNIYADSKVFVDRMFNGINFEIENDPRTKGKIDVLTYQPGPVATKLSRMPLGIGIPSPLKAAQNSLKDLGKKVVSNSILEHDIVGRMLAWGGQTMPWIVSYSLY
jgi:short-subunit dehydrogenase